MSSILFPLFHSRTEKKVLRMLAKNKILLTYLFRSKVSVSYCQKLVDIYVIYWHWHIQLGAKAPIPLQLAQMFLPNGPNAE